MKHDEEPLYLFLPELTGIDNFVIDAKNVYNPASAGDTGGLVVFVAEDSYLSLEEYYSAAQGTVRSYQWLRLIRNRNDYDAYWSDTGARWRVVGTQSLSASNPKIGLFLRGDTGLDMNVECVRVLRSTKVKVGNITEGTVVRMYNAADAKVDERACTAGRTFVEFDMTEYPAPFTGTFTVQLAEGAVIESVGSFDIWPGDEYSFDVGADLYYQNESDDLVPLATNIEQFIGYMNSGGASHKDIRMVAKNNLTTGTLDNLTISTKPYHDTDQYTRLISLSVDGTMFDNSITTPSVAAGAQFEFWLRVERESVEAPGNDVYFGLDLASAYHA
ncbi:MAG: hypothetical protein J7559_12255 [Cohnella sp.]|nr:hypothetical protein [Cohnella sp.]